uniref:protein-L-isoaspartate(D-aspartate) O-methyltransferase n=1 Tax=Cacopsylla melanoneura TaxID=428564 RepID=A0A8D8W1G5_9HEMI
MRCFFVLVLTVSVFVLAKAQYDDNQGPEPVQANAYYDNEGPAHYNENQVPGVDGQHQPPQQVGQNYGHAHAQGQGQGQAPIRRVASPILNDTFSLPPYYHSISTTRRTVKVNRRTYAQQIDTLVRDGALKTPRVVEAFHKVDRGYFVHRLEDEPYGFMARKLGRGVFMEKPHMQARIIELLEEKLQEGNRVLDIGSGTAFMSCVFAELVGNTGKVFAVEHMKDQCEESWDNVLNVRPDLIHDGRLHIRCRDGRVGLPNVAPYDAIFFSTYIPDIPNSILLQLKPGGRLVCGIGKSRSFHRLVVIDRSEDGDSFSKYDLGTENFVNPLVGSNDQNDNWLYQQARKRIVEARNQGFSGLNLAKKLRLFTLKPVDLRKLEDDTFKFVEV